MPAGDYSFYIQFSENCPSLGLENSIVMIYSQKQCTHIDKSEECYEFDGKKTHAK